MEKFLAMDVIKKDKLDLDNTQNQISYGNNISRSKNYELRI